MDELLAELLADLEIELGVTDASDIAILTVKIKNAAREVSQTRNYPSSFEEATIVDDLEKYYSNIRKLAMYDYNQVGAELQASHNENGVNRAYIERMKCFNGVPSYARF